MPTRLRLARSITLAGLLLGLLVPPFAAAGEDGATEPSVVEAPVAAEEALPAPPAPEPALRPIVRPLQSLADVPGTLLIASSREKPGLGDTNDRYRLFTLQGGELTRLRVPDEELGPSGAALSRDGKRLLAVAGSRAIYVVDLAGGAAPRPLLERLEPLSPGQTDAYLAVAWSADESRALVARPQPNGITLVSVADGAPVRTPYLGLQVSLSPDGQQIAFTYLAPGQPAAATYLAPASGQAEPRKLTPGQTYELLPTWLPDGQRIAYLARGEVWEVRLWDQAAGAERVLARAPSGEVAIASYALSPDGAWVAYTLQDDRTLSRRIRIASTLDPSVGLDLQAGAWNDRVMGWAGGEPARASTAPAATGAPSSQSGS